MMEEARILVVDKSNTMLRLISNLAYQIGIKEVITCFNGHEAIEALEQDEYDLVITEWRMPVMDGLALVKRIRSENKELPIMMVSVEGDRNSVVTALKAGVNSYIVKPFEARTLKEKIEELINGGV